MEQANYISMGQNDKLLLLEWRSRKQAENSFNNECKAKKCPKNECKFGFFSATTNSMRHIVRPYGCKPAYHKINIWKKTRTEIKKIDLYQYYKILKH